MSNKQQLTLEILHQIDRAITTIQKRFRTIQSVEDFLTSDAGLERLDSICMLYIAIGESLKNLDKVTNQQLLDTYPTVDWKQAKGMRDVISHHYFDLNAEAIYNTCKDDLPTLEQTIQQLIADLEAE